MIKHLLARIDINMGTFSKGQKRIAKYFFYFKVSSISFPVAQGKGNNQPGEKVSQGIDNTSIKIN